MAPHPRVISPPGPFRKDDKVRKRPEYKSVYHRAAPMYTARLVFYACPGEGPLRRLGCTVPKVVGDAVERNRLKRLIRVGFRQTRDRLPEGCVLVVNAKRSAAGMTIEDVLRHFLDVVGRLEREGFRPCAP